MGVLRIEVMEVGQPAMPAIDLDGASIVIGSAPAAQLRLPAQVARDEHLRLEGGRWSAIGAVIVDGVARETGASGEIGAGVAFELGESGRLLFRVRVAPAPAGTKPSPPQRTESLARELMRGLLGGDAAPTLEIERGPAAGAKRALPPPEATVVIGRGDEATWVIADEDLSRAHAEIRRGWDGTTVRDLASKNGTRVNGTKLREAAALHDGATIELGGVTLRFRDPAERHLRGAAPPRVTPVAPQTTTAWPFWIAVAIAAVAALGLVWVVAS